MNTNIYIIVIYLLKYMTLCMTYKRCIWKMDMELLKEESETRLNEARK